LVEAKRKACAFGQAFFYTGMGFLSDGAYSQNREHDENDGDHKEDKEQHLGDAGCACSNTGETEYTGYERHDRKYDGPFEHENLLKILLKDINDD